MSDLFWLSQSQLDRIAPHFPLSHGVPHVGDLRIISGIIHVIKQGLQWWMCSRITTLTKRCITTS